MSDEDDDVRNGPESRNGAGSGTGAGSQNADEPTGTDQATGEVDPERDAGDGARDRGRSVRGLLRRLVGASGVERLFISLAALLLAVVVGAFIILASGKVATCQTAAAVYFGSGFCYDPIEVYLVLFNGAFGDPFALGSPRLFTEGWELMNFGLALTLKETTLLIFTGLSVAVAFRAGLFNIGTQGQLVLGSLATALAVHWTVPVVPAGVGGTVVLVTLGLLVGALVGGLYGVIPGALKAYADANEVITTIMLNFVAAQVAFVLVTMYFKDPNSSAVQTTPIPAYGRLMPSFFPEGSAFSMLALAVAFALVGVVYYLLEHTAFGYDLRTSGLQPEAARYGGVNAERTTVVSFFLSGALGGIGGGVWVLMVMGRWLSDVPAIGFDGITVSILAGNNPLGVGFAALLFGVLKSGSVAVQFETGVPPELIAILRGLIILFVAMPEFFRLIGDRVVDLGPEERSVATDGGRPLGDAGADAGGEPDE